MKDNSPDEKKIGDKEDDYENNIIKESDYLSGSETETDKQDEHSDLNLDSEGFEDHDNDDKQFMDA